MTNAETCAIVTQGRNRPRYTNEKQILQQKRHNYFLLFRLRIRGKIRRPNNFPRGQRLSCQRVKQTTRHSFLGNLRQGKGCAGFCEEKWRKIGEKIKQIKNNSPSLSRNYPGRGLGRFTSSNENSKKLLSVGNLNVSSLRSPGAGIERTGHKGIQGSAANGAAMVEMRGEEQTNLPIFLTY